jgi:hypothetical protein
MIFYCKFDPSFNYLKMAKKKGKAKEAVAPKAEVPVAYKKLFTISHRATHRPTNREMAVVIQAMKFGPAVQIYADRGEKPYFKTFKATQEKPVKVLNDIKAEFLVSQEVKDLIEGYLNGGTEKPKRGLNRQSDIEEEINSPFK